jgi:hypothetical protein
MNKKDVTKIRNSRDFEVVSDALRAIPFPIAYSDWLRIGFALWESFEMEGMQLLYDVSCAPFPEYQNETPEKLAAKFRNANGSVSLGTIFHLARQHGWQYKRPAKIQNKVWHLVAWHDYTDAQGNFAYRMNRYVSPDGSEKRMAIERYENGLRKTTLPPEFRLPYNLPQVREAIEQGKTVYFVEGESDADALEANGYTATCVPFGAGGWNKRYVEHFKGASICFIPDNDSAGKELPLKAIPDLLSVAKDVKVIELCDAKDVRELINMKGIEAFLSLTAIDANHYLEKHKLSEKYPLTKINATVPENDLDDSDSDEIQTLDSFANIDYTFDESLVPNGIFREVYDYVKREADAPAQFIFTGVLAMLCGIAGTRISLQFGMQRFKPHDYFTLIANSGGGKSTTLESVRAILSALEKAVTDKDKPYQNVFLYPQSSTLRGLLDVMREESEAELQAREIAREKGKPEPPQKFAQRSGVAIIDEVSALFDATRSDFNTGLDATLLELWDGNPRMIATSIRTDGKMRFEDTALTLLSASTPRKFVERLPKGAFLDGMLPRFQIINAGSRVQPRKPLTSFTKRQANHSEIVEKLKHFHQFVCGLSQSQTPVLISDDAKALDEQSLQVWHEESIELKDETADAYMMRIDTRKVRYALLFSLLECYDQHGRFADAITLTGTAMQRAIEICDFFKTHTLHFLVKAKAIKPKAPNEREPMPERIKNKLIELGGTVDKRELRRAMNLDEQTFMTALNQLLVTKQVVLTKRKGKKGHNVNVVTIPKKIQNGYASYATYATLEITTTETSPKPQNASKWHKPKWHNAYASLDYASLKTTVPEPTVAPESQPTVPGPIHPEPVNPEPPVPEPINPEPMPVPEPEPEPIQPMPVVEPETEPTIAAKPVAKPESLLLANACEIARSLHAKFTENEFLREATLFGATPQTAKQMIYALLRDGYLVRHEHIFVRTEKLYAPEPQAKPKRGDDGILPDDEFPF